MVHRHKAASSSFWVDSGYADDARSHTALVIAYTYREHYQYLYDYNHVVSPISVAVAASCCIYFYRFIAEWHCRTPKDWMSWRLFYPTYHNTSVFSRAYGVAVPLVQMDNHRKYTLSVSLSSIVYCCCSCLCPWPSYSMHYIVLTFTISL